MSKAMGAFAQAGLGDQAALQEFYLSTVAGVQHKIHDSLAEAVPAFGSMTEQVSHLTSEHRVQ